MDTPYQCGAWVRGGRCIESRLEPHRHRNAQQAEVERLRAVIAAFVEHHDNGQAGQPGHPKTYGEEDVWQAEWDRRYAALKED